MVTSMCVTGQYISCSILKVINFIAFSMEQDIPCCTCSDVIFGTHRMLGGLLKVCFMNRRTVFMEVKLSVLIAWASCVLVQLIVCNSLS